MKYHKVYHEFDKDDCVVWHVYEKATGQILESFFFEEDAVAFAIELDNGRAFSGFTPSFILRKVIMKNDINEAFHAEFA